MLFLSYNLSSVYHDMISKFYHDRNLPETFFGSYAQVPKTIRAPSRLICSSCRNDELFFRK